MDRRALVHSIAGSIDGIVQGSLFGVAGSFPPVYMQGYMTGIGFSGVAAAIARIGTKLYLPADPEGLRTSCIVFFLVSSAYSLLCAVLYYYVCRLPFYRFYMSRVLSFQPEDGDTNVNATKDSKGTTATASGDAEAPPSSRPAPAPQEVPYRLLFRQMRTVLPLPLLAWFVTLALFPGLTSEIVSSNGLGDWMPVLSATIFNVADFLGRWVTRWRWANQMRFKLLWLLVLGRFVFFPLLMICVKPHVIQNDALSLSIVFLFAYSSGHLGNIAMMIGPQRVVEALREQAGMLMGFSMIVGLTTGASVSFLLLLWL